MNGPVVLILVLHIIVFAAVMAELCPRTITLWQLRDGADGYGQDRARTWMKSAGLALISGYEALIWADALFFGQEVLGPFTLRWHVDAAMWTLLAFGSVLVAQLYWAVVRQERHEVPPSLIAQADHEAVARAAAAAEAIRIAAELHKGSPEE